MPYSLENFTLKITAECSCRLRKSGHAAANLDEAANLIVNHFHKQFVVGNSGADAFALARLFVTRDYGQLSNDPRAFTRRNAGNQ